MKSKQKRNNSMQTVILRNLAILLIIITTISKITETTMAHSPSTLTVSYNLQTQELRVTIAHQVTNPTTHYIKEVHIIKNGASYNTTQYIEQPDPNSFTYSYSVNATIGDTIEVTTSCIQGGSKTTQHTITQPNTTGNGNGSSTPGFELLLALGAMLSCVILLRKKRN